MKATGPSWFLEGVSPLQLYMTDGKKPEKRGFRESNGRMLSSPRSRGERREYPWCSTNTQILHIYKYMNIQINIYPFIIYCLLPLGVCVWGGGRRGGAGGGNPRHL